LRKIWAEALVAVNKGRVGTTPKPRASNKASFDFQVWEDCCIGKLLNSFRFKWVAKIDPIFKQLLRSNNSLDPVKLNPMKNFEVIGSEIQAGECDSCRQPEKPWN
jgi:hypothetical protein